MTSEIPAADPVSIPVVDLPAAGSVSIPVVDLFAGPGGLNEGFSSIGEDEGAPLFQTVASFEMEANAVKTLKLRSIYRHLKRNGGVPQSYYDYITGVMDWDEFTTEPRVDAAVEAADEHVHEIELGQATRNDVGDRIKKALAASPKNASGDWVLIGGPPCQAYSLAGRSRRTNDIKFAFDKKHFLYEEYLDILRRFKPTVFVMENVKGLLSSKNHGVSMVDQILNDLRRPSDSVSYDVRSLVVDPKNGKILPKEYVIRAEDYGIPQKRHRIILLGVRTDVVKRTDYAVLKETPKVTVRDAIADLPILRSRISPMRFDSDENWEILRQRAVARRGALEIDEADDSLVQDFTEPETTVDGSGIEALIDDSGSDDPKIRYQKWIHDDYLEKSLQHQSRSHMESDIERYAHLAWKAGELGKSPKFSDLPAGLEPNHKNIGQINTPFLDRFRVQIWDEPATTIVSHISKDGHYYIHPDESQMRSLTVREAARLQTFPDNYFFEGTRTMQYHQVGNAVPPLLARLIAEKVVETLRLDGKSEKRIAKTG
ncbi:DNA cytosine methyltransferase [Arthrobacter sp. SDTb3-6]|uniref:DNA cytosine methyltransferase n=1 Tax=Arthrobacter sp. SDTb3-6 TaxID=2713571 RepID=UPI00159D1717|nr:DNA cytosine methyltransferase [Arthrobacter sp. SDTb3-6]NVM98426.1 DNA cytosine methyltransferase [Arthrobacter sp. SDTb3-6]